MQRIVVEKKYVKKAKKYADLRNSKGDYDSYVNNRQASKPWFDDFVGKIGEFAVWLYLANRCIHIPEPDCSYHKVKKKSFKPDLDGNRCVKAAPKSNLQYGLSWVFQRKPKDKILSKDNEYVFCPTFVVLDRDSDFDTDVVVAVFGDIPSSMVRKNIKDMRLAKHRHTKGAVYAKDLDPYIKQEDVDTISRW